MLWPLYAKLEKLQKRISCNILLSSISATLTKKIQTKILEKSGFLPNYRLMQTLLDYPETMQIYHFIKHTKASCLDLQFILPKTAKKAKNIQKTIIFVNSIKEICPLIEIIQDWIIKLGYPESSSTWIRPYYSDVSGQDKALIVNAFITPGDFNLKCTILVATDV